MEQHFFKRQLSPTLVCSVSPRLGPFTTFCTLSSTLLYLFLFPLKRVEDHEFMDGPSVFCFILDFCIFLEHNMTRGICGSIQALPLARDKTIRIE